MATDCDFEGTIPECRGNRQQCFSVFICEMDSGCNRPFFKLKFHFIKNINELSCFYCLCQASIPVLPKFLQKASRAPPNSPDSIWYLDALNPPIFPQAPSSLLLEFPNLPLGLCLPAQLSPPWETSTCFSGQESRLSLQPVDSQYLNSYLHTG